MITHLLDTNIVSYLMRSQPANVRDRLQALGPDRVAMSVITVLELREGADRHPHPDRYHPLIDGFQQEISTLPFPIEAAPIGGRLRARLKKNGLVMGDFDSLIAAHALTLSVILVTNDSAFQRITGLHVENWA